MSYLARPTKRGFRVVEEVKIDGKKVVKTLPLMGYAELGFRKDMTLVEAKARARQINQQNQVHAKKVANTARRVELKKLTGNAFLPDEMVSQFEAKLEEIYLRKPYRLEITKRYWRAAQLAILELAMDPKDYEAASTNFLNYCVERHWSHDYVKRITRMLNLWGSFCARKRGTHFEPMPRLDSMQINDIADSREGVKGVRGPAEPLNWDTLKNARDKFESEGLIEQWNWMCIATWFGLRPLEVDNLKKSKFMRMTRSQGTEILEVYQTKLTRIKKENRWKPIPVFLKEQKFALNLIKSGHFKRPLNKTLRRILGEGVETYSPRKGFTDMMLEAGFALEDISTFLGHHSIEMTWQKYKDRRRFKLPKNGLRKVG